MQDFIDQNTNMDDASFWPFFWDHFKPRENRFYLFDHKPDWDSLEIQMKLLRDTKNVVMQVADYPSIIPRGHAGGNMASWEFILSKVQKLKAFANQDGQASYIITPAQFDASADSLRYSKGVVNACDLFLKGSVKDGDSGLGPMGATTWEYGAYRNYLSIPGEPTLEPFKLINAFDRAKFVYLDF